MELNYTILSLRNLLAAFNNDIEKAKDYLVEFECQLNQDVENFLRHKAIMFDQLGYSKTHLVYTSYKGNQVLVGYFTLANKNFIVRNKSNISKTLKKKIAKFGRYEEELKQYTISAPLIGQLGKNDRYKNLISGDILLKYACDEVRKAQEIMGGKFVYLECEDKEVLKDFYKSNGFVEFGKRELEADEKNDIGGKHLIQLLKYLKEEHSV